MKPTYCFVFKLTATRGSSQFCVNAQSQAKEESLNEKETSDNSGRIGVGNFLILAIAFAAFGALLYWSWNFVGPSGQTFEIGPFILFWLREILLFGIVGIVLICAAILWFSRFFRRLLAKDENEL